jgi:hypothetical protein
VSFELDAMEQAVNQAAKELANEIDTQVMMSVMGWHECTLEVSEGRVYGARYLTVHPTNGSKWNDMMSWMVETFGPTAHDGVWTPNMRWYANNAKFWFRNKKDLAWFMLKWS